MAGSGHPADLVGGDPVVPAIHFFSDASDIKTWMPGLKPGMTAGLRPDSTTEDPAMPDPFAELRHELAVANRILANEGIIDAFGHISVRNPKDPNRYFISRHRASELVRSEEHTSELQSQSNLVCRLLLEKKKKTKYNRDNMSTHVYLVYASQR